MLRKIAVIIISMAVLLIPVTAGAVFTLELSQTSVDFGNMDSGASGSYRDDIPHQGLEVLCTTDQGNSWWLRIRNEQPLTHISNPAATIANTNLKWYGVSTSDSNNTSLVTLREDFTVEKTVYTAPAAETQTTITMKFELTVPPVIQSGAYTSNIVFTLTE